MTKCSNCGNTQGPFASWAVFNETYYTCKNTKTAQKRAEECVKRRDKIDYDKYKEQMNLL